jgi:hypothetical protein
LKRVHAEHRPADYVADGFFAEQAACRIVDDKSCIAGESKKFIFDNIGRAQIAGCLYARL